MTSCWERMNAEPRRAVPKVDETDVPTEPGVYAFYHQGTPVYVGRAMTGRGLRDRVWKNHLALDTDLSRSSFRRNVCEELGIAPTAITRQRPPQLRVEQVEVVNEWVRDCEVAWVTLGSADEADKFERAIKLEWKPRLTKR